MRTSIVSSLVRASALVAGWVASAPAHAQVQREEHFGTTTLEYFGASCANVRDVDGDGIDDFLVGSPLRGKPLLDGGRATLFSGATGALIRTHDGSTTGENFGTCVASAGDVDGDGIPDYMVSAPRRSTSLTFVGEVVVYSGSTGAFIWSVYGPVANGVLGNSIAGVGDMDGDGKDDVVIGTRSDDVYVLGANGVTIWHLTGAISFGYAVSGCGDVDGDGVPDFLVGEPLRNSKVPPRTDCGAVHVVSGATGTDLYLIHGTHSFDRLGVSLAPLGDVDHDGVPDFLAGSPYADANGTDSGIVRVVSGATGATIREQTGDAAGDEHGHALCGLGDVDLDGTVDYAVGAPDANGGPGRVRVCSGATGVTIWDFAGVDADSNLGSAVAGGDWNNDGVGDLLAGDSYRVRSGNTHTGSASVELMCPAWSASYGPGWPGKNGIPTLTAQQVPAVGAPLDVDLSNSLGSPTTALLLVGVQEENLPIGNSGTLLVAPLVSILVAVPAAGVTISGALPNDPALDFFDVFLQALELDSFASKGLSFTAGLQLHCGFDLP